MPKYKIKWETVYNSESFVEATSLKEAQHKAERGESKDFDVWDEYPTEEIYEVIELDASGKETENFLELE